LLLQEPISDITVREIPPLSANIETIKYNKNLLQYSLSRKRDFQATASKELVLDKEYVAKRKISAYNNARSSIILPRVEQEHRVSVQDTIMGIALLYDMKY
jgi:hypothetical protein